MGGPAAGPGRPGRPVARDPPAGDQRLPAQGGWHPGLPVGAVAPARSRLLRRADRQFPPRRPGLRPGPGRAAASASSGCPSRVLAPTPRLVRRIRDTARRIGADLVVLDPVFPSAWSVPASVCPTPCCCTGPRWPSPGGCPVGRAAGGPRAAPQRCWPCRPAGYPAAEAPPAAPPAGGMPPVVEIPPGVDLDRFRPLSPAERAEARADLGLPADGPLVVSVSRLVPRKGMDVLIDAAVRLRADRARPHRGHRRSGSGLGPPGRPDRRVRRPRCVCSAPCPTPTCPAWSARPTSSSWCAATGGWASSRRGSASSSSRPPRPGCPRWPARPVAPMRPSSPGSPGLVVRRPTDVGAVARAIGDLLADADLRARMGAASRRRVEASFDYDKLAPRLAASLADVEG